MNGFALSDFPLERTCCVIFFVLANNRFTKEVGIVVIVAGLILIPVCVDIEKFMDNKAQIVQHSEQTASAVRQEDKAFMGKMDEQTVQNRTIGVKILEGN